MASKQYYHDIDLVGVGQLVNARLHSVTDTEMNALVAGLGAENKGLTVYNETDNKQYIWTGTEFRADALYVVGSMVYRGALAAAAFGTRPTHTDTGSQYAIAENGTLSFLASDGTSPMTFVPSAEVEAGDMVIFTDPDTAHVIQKNDVYASDTVAGNILLATSQEVRDGVDETKAVTPKALWDLIESRKIPKVYVGTHSLTIGDTTINHGLSLKGIHHYVMSVKDAAGVEVAVKHAIDTADTLIITALAPINNAQITIIGY